MVMDKTRRPGLNWPRLEILARIGAESGISIQASNLSRLDVTVLKGGTPAQHPRLLRARLSHAP